MLNAYQRRRNGRILGAKEVSCTLECSTLTSVGEMVGCARSSSRSRRPCAQRLPASEKWSGNLFRPGGGGGATCSTLTSVGEMVGSGCRRKAFYCEVLNAYQRRRNGRRSARLSSLGLTRAQRLPASEKWSDVLGRTFSGPSRVLNAYQRRRNGRSTE